jgi:hypothetical protein
VYELIAIRQDFKMMKERTKQVEAHQTNIIKRKQNKTARIQSLYKYRYYSEDDHCILIIIIYNNFNISFGDYLLHSIYIDLIN